MHISTMKSLVKVHKKELLNHKIDSKQLEEGHATELKQMYELHVAEIKVSYILRIIIFLSRQFQLNKTNLFYAVILETSESSRNFTKGE